MVIKQIKHIKKGIGKNIKNLEAKRIYIIVLITVLLLTVLIFYYGFTKPSEDDRLVIQVGSAIVKAEVADDEIEQLHGLMFRESLARDGGMFFVFNSEEQLGFWMKNMKFPIDIIFIDKDFRIVDIKENFRPCVSEPCEIYYSKPAQYALEVNNGFVQVNEIGIGDKVIVR